MSVQLEPAGNGDRPQRTFLGHPIGLYVLFFTEMWERFSYYGMRALLMLYMVNYFRWTQREASGIYKWYTSLVYLTPLLGGFLADRYLGNKRAVIIGAVLMAIGHFLMAFEDLAIFYSALGFLILGNGFFKPNMSVQVGRLYPANDARRDGAYTIFYMGINLGAFLSPIVCGWLAVNTAWSYHAGFTAAGVGMVIGLLIYIFGLPLIKELDPNQPSLDGDKATDSPTTGGEHVAKPGEAPTEPECERIPSAMPTVNRIAATGLVAVGTVVAIAAPVLWFTGVRTIFDFIFFELIAGCAFMAAWILTGVHQAVRDRVLAIYALAVFVVFFWGGFEQAGNVMNVWADQSTDRYVWTDTHPPPLKPTEKEVQADGWLASLFNPMPTAWFQAINALAIVALAPLFAWFWTESDRRGWNFSIPLKMALGILFLSLSFALMVGAARSENLETRVPLPAMPSGVPTKDSLLLQVDDKGNATEPFFAGRLAYDAAAKNLVVHGALPIVERDRILAQTAPEAFVKEIEALNKKAKDLKADESVTARIQNIPPGFDWTYTDFKDPKTGVTYATYTESDQSITLKSELAGKDILALKVAGSDPAFREVLNEAVRKSSRARVSWWWLFWAYILATLGELCLSPVGLSMVSKLAPAKYATMLMGMWLLTSTFGQFLGGELGERYGSEWDPTEYFVIFFFGTLAAAAILFVLVKKIGAMMHGVR